MSHSPSVNIDIQPRVFYFYYPTWAISHPTDQCKSCTGIESFGQMGGGDYKNSMMVGQFSKGTGDLTGREERDVSNLVIVITKVSSVKERATLAPYSSNSNLQLLNMLGIRVPLCLAHSERFQ